MKPCRRCRAPIENNVSICPHCSAAQDDGPKVNPGDGPPRRGIVRQLISDLTSLEATPLLLGFLGAVVLIAVCGFLGLQLVGPPGAVMGSGIAVAFVIFVLVVLEMGGLD